MGRVGCHRFTVFWIVLDGRDVMASCSIMMPCLFPIDPALLSLFFYTSRSVDAWKGCEAGPPALLIVAVSGAALLD